MSGARERVQPERKRKLYMTYASTWHLEILLSDNDVCASEEGESEKRRETLMILLFTCKIIPRVSGREREREFYETLLFSPRFFLFFFCSVYRIVRLGKVSCRGECDCALFPKAAAAASDSRRFTER